MPHVLTVIGLGMEILGSGFLSYDLLKSKSAEDELGEFRHLQSEIETGLNR